MSNLFSNTDNVSRDKNIGELMNILSSNQKTQEADLITMFLEEIQQMNEKFNAVVKELNTVKDELRHQDNIPQSAKRQNVFVVVDSIAEAENLVKSQQQQLHSMQSGMSDKAATLVQKFKETGIKGLNKVCEFLGIKESLVKLKDMAQSNAVSMQNSIDQIDNIESEVKSAITHTKNAGKAMQEKESVDSADAKLIRNFEKVKTVYSKQIKSLEKTKSTYQKWEDKFSKQVEKLSKGIERFDALERAANKASIKDKLKSNQAAIAEKKATEPKLEKEKPKQQEMALSM